MKNLPDRSLFLRYIMAGSAASLVDIVLFNVLVHRASSYYLVVAIFSNAFSFFIRFFLQKYFAFRRSGMVGMQRQLLTYAILFAFSLVATGLFMAILVQGFGVNLSIAQIITIGMVAVISFFVYRHIVFTEPDPKKLLIFTQKMDRNDPVLGFFYEWVREISKHFNSVTVICLEKGEVDPKLNAEVFSLGKESGGTKLKYILNFYRLLLRLRGKYGSVFVHMNQEYVLLGGLIWRIFGKKIYMWRNHHAGNILTDLAAVFCNKVFCTSKYSYTAKYKKIMLMPVGIDTEKFKPMERESRVPNSILFLGRIAPVKKPDLLLKSLGKLDKEKLDFKVSFYGDPIQKDVGYYESLKKLSESLALSNRVSFHHGIPNSETVNVYSTNEIFVNLSSSGMYDKTIFEAMACETLVLASNRNLIGLIDDRCVFKEGDATDLAQKIEALLRLGYEEKEIMRSSLQRFVIENHSLALLGASLAEAIK